MNHYNPVSQYHHPFFRCFYCPYQTWIPRMKAFRRGPWRREAVGWLTMVSTRVSQRRIFVINMGVTYTVTMKVILLCPSLLGNLISVRALECQRWRKLNTFNTAMFPPLAQWGPSCRTNGATAHWCSSTADMGWCWALRKYGRLSDGPPPDQLQLLE